jgi:predicted ATP-dependent serine protease
MSIKPIRLKEKEAIIQSLKSGVTPKIGLQHIQVGRSKEISALNKDIDRVIEGGSTFRLIIGEYGSGKTFFLSVVRSIALEKKLVTVHADLSPDRRIHASGGQARNLYSELIRNMATRNKPDGNALTSVVERFITEAIKEADNTNIAVSTVIQNKLSSLADLVGGYDFAKVIEAIG